MLLSLVLAVFGHGHHRLPIDNYESLNRRFSHEYSGSGFDKVLI